MSYLKNSNLQFTFKIETCPKNCSKQKDESPHKTESKKDMEITDTNQYEIQIMAKIYVFQDLITALTQGH